MDLPINQKTTPFLISNTTAILDFTDSILPQPTQSFFPHAQIHHALTTIYDTITTNELKATQRILDNDQFRHALQPSNPNPALIKLDIRNLPTNPLTLLSAILAHTIPATTPFPILAFFCSRTHNFNQDNDGTPSDPHPLPPTPIALTITTTLTTQLLHHLSTHHPKIDLTGTMLATPNGAHFRSKVLLNDSAELLSTLLLALPQGETIYIIVDNVGQLDLNSEYDLVLALARVLALTRHRVSLKVVVTGTRGGLSEWLDESFRGAEGYTAISTTVGHSFKGGRVELEGAFEMVRGWMVGGF